MIPVSFMGLGAVQAGLKWLSSTLLPDGGLGSVAGKGWTCTGLVYDLALDCFWVGNDGRGAPGDITHEPSIIQLSKDLTTIIFQIDIHAADPSLTGITSLQGVAIDKNTDTIYAVAPYENLLIQFDKQGNFIKSVSTPAQFSGIANDPANDTMAVVTMARAVYTYHIQTEVFDSFYAVPIPGEVTDQLYFDEETEYLYISVGTNGPKGSIVIMDHQAQTLVTRWDHIENSLAIEGLAWTGTNDLHIANDQYFHNVDPALNQIMKYEADRIDVDPALNLWTPAEIIGDLGAWIDGSDASTLTPEKAGLITDVKGKSNNARDFSQAVVADQPSSGIANLGYRNVLSYDEAFLEVTSFNTRAVIFVTNNLDGADTNPTVSPIFQGVSAEYTFTRPNILSYDISIDGTGATSGSASINGNTKVAGKNIALGMSIADKASPTIWYVEYDSTIDVTKIGRTPDITLKGEMPEMVFFDAIPTNEIYEKTIASLAWKYDGGVAGVLVGKLPVSNPYKTSPPLV